MLHIFLLKNDNNLQSLITNFKNIITNWKNDDSLIPLNFYDPLLISLIILLHFLKEPELNYL